MEAAWRGRSTKVRKAEFSNTVTVNAADSQEDLAGRCLP